MSLWDALRLGPTAEVEELEQGDARPSDATGGSSQQQGRHQDKQQPAPLAGGIGGLWGVASAVTAATAAVRAAATDVVRSVQETDWASELATFGAEVKHDAEKVSHEVGSQAQALGAKAKEVVQHLPEHLPLDVAGESAGGSGGGARGSASSGGGGGSAGAGGTDGSGVGGGGRGGDLTSVAAAAASGLGGVGASISKLGLSIISSAKGVVEQVTDIVEGELNAVVADANRGQIGDPVGRRRGRGAAAMARSASQGTTKYSRFEAEVAAMQRDSSTYCDEPADADEYAEWRSSDFDLAGEEVRIAALLKANALVAELQARLVPLLVEREEFWARYFYRLHKLQQREDQRQQLAARAKQQVADNDEEIGWDDDVTGPPSPPAKASEAKASEARAPEAMVSEASKGAQSGGGEPKDESKAEPEVAAGGGGSSSSGASAGTSSGERPQAARQEEAAAGAAEGAEAAEAAPAAAPAALVQGQGGSGSGSGASGGSGSGAKALPQVAVAAASASSGLSTPVRVASDGEESAATEGNLHLDTASEGSLPGGAGGQHRGWTVVSTGAGRGASKAPSRLGAQPEEGPGTEGDGAAAAEGPGAEGPGSPAKAAAGPPRAHALSAAGVEAAEAGSSGGAAPAAAAGPGIDAAAAGDLEGWGDDDGAVGQAAAAAAKPEAAKRTKGEENDWSDDWE